MTNLLDIENNIAFLGFQIQYVVMSMDFEVWLSFSDNSGHF